MLELVLVLVLVLVPSATLPLLLPLPGLRVPRRVWRIAAGWWVAASQPLRRTHQPTRKILLPEKNIYVPTKSRVLTGERGQFPGDGPGCTDSQYLSCQTLLLQIVILIEQVGSVWRDDMHSCVLEKKLLIKDGLNS